MSKDTKGQAGAELAPIPTKLKELMTACELEIPDFKYKFHSKPEMTDLLLAQRAKGTTTPVVVKEDKKAEPKKSVKKVAKVSTAESTDDSVEMPDPANNEDKKPPVKKENAKKAEPKKDAVPAKATKAVKDDVSDAKPSKKKAGSSPEDIAKLKERKDVAAILGNEKYTTSDKVRSLYHKATPTLTIGDIAKVLDIHYSFAYCVVDTYRKGLLNEKKDAKK